MSGLIGVAQADPSAQAMPAVYGRVRPMDQSLSHPVSPLKGGHLADKVEQARVSVDSAPSEF